MTLSLVNFVVVWQTIFLKQNVLAGQIVGPSASPLSNVVVVESLTWPGWWRQAFLNGGMRCVNVMDAHQSVQSVIMTVPISPSKKAMNNFKYIKTKRYMYIFDSSLLFFSVARLPTLFVRFQMKSFGPIGPLMSVACICDPLWKLHWLSQKSGEEISKPFQNIQS